MTSSNSNSGRGLQHTVGGNLIYSKDSGWAGRRFILSLGWRAAVMLMQRHSRARPRGAGPCKILGCASEPLRRDPAVMVCRRTRWRLATGADQILSGAAVGSLDTLQSRSSLDLSHCRICLPSAVQATPVDRASLGWIARNRRPGLGLHDIRACRGGKQFEIRFLPRQGAHNTLSVLDTVPRQSALSPTSVGRYRVALCDLCSQLSARL